MVTEEGTHRCRLWQIFGSEQFLWNVRVFHRAWPRKILAEAAQEKQEGIQGQWQQESPFKEVLEQVKRNAYTDCNAQNNAPRLQCLQEAYDKVAMEDIGRLSIAQEISRNSTDFLRRIITLVSGIWRRDLVLRLPSLRLLPSSGCRLDTSPATTERRSTVVGGAQHAAANTTGKRPTGYWWCSVPVPMKRRCLERTQRR